MKCEERYNKARTVHSIMRHVAEKLNMDLEQLYIEIGWPLYKKYGHAYDGFKLALTKPEEVFEGLTPSSSNAIPELLSQISRRLTPQPVKLRADIEVTCFAPAGVDAIKEALKSGETKGTETTPIKIKLVAPPLYVMITNTADKEGGIAAMQQSIEEVERVLTKLGGEVVVKMKPTAVTENDDAELAKLMQRMEAENEEKSGDEDEDEEIDSDS